LCGGHPGRGVPTVRNDRNVGAAISHPRDDVGIVPYGEIGMVREYAGAVNDRPCIHTDQLVFKTKKVEKNKSRLKKF